MSQSHTGHVLVGMDTNYSLSTSSLAVNACAGVRHIKQMMQACDNLPVNYGIVGKGSDSGKPGLNDQINAGVVALKLHEDFGCTPLAIDTCLRLVLISCTSP